MKTIFRQTIISSVLLICIPHFASAAVNNITGANCAFWGIWCTGADTTVTIITILWNLLDVVFAFLATVAAIALVYYGIKYIISKGDEESTHKAKTGIVYAILGMIIVGLAAWIVNAVLNL